MSFLNLENKNILVVGVANKKSVAFHIGKTLQQEGANVLYSVRTKERKKQIEKLVVPSSIYEYTCELSVHTSMSPESLIGPSCGRLKRGSCQLSRH